MTQESGHRSSRRAAPAPGHPPPPPNFNVVLFCGAQGFVDQLRTATLKFGGDGCPGAGAVRRDERFPDSWVKFSALGRKWDVVVSTLLQYLPKSTTRPQCNDGERRLVTRRGRQSAADCRSAAAGLLHTGGIVTACGKCLRICCRALISSRRAADVPMSKRTSPGPWIHIEFCEGRTS